MFPAGTQITAGLAGSVNGTPIVTITGNNATGNVTFTTPVTVPVLGTFVVLLHTGITNPATAANYTLSVATDIDTTLVPSQQYHIYAQPAVNLGTSFDFAVLGAAVTLTDSTVTGDVGSTGVDVTSTGSLVTGIVYDGGAAAVTTAYTDFQTAYAAVEAMTVDEALPDGTLAGVTVFPGVYSFDITAKTGTLTLDALGNANAVWIFKTAVATGYLTGTNFIVNIINGGQARNVYWWTDAAVTLTTSTFQGTILSGAAVTTTGSNITGRALATAGATISTSSIALPAAASALTVIATPTVLTGNAVSTYTVNITTITALTVAVIPDRIIITFPNGFDARGAAVDTVNTTTTSATDPTLVSATRTVVTLVVTADMPAGVQIIVLSGIINTQTAGPFVVMVKTQDGDSTPIYNTIDGPTASNAFTTTSAGVDLLTVQFQPTRTMSGVAIAPAVQVKSTNATGNATAGVYITASLQTGTGTLSGNITRLTDALGVATFDTLSIDLGGANKVLRFTYGATTVDSTVFTVTYITVNPIAGLVTDETGVTDTFTIVLDVAPTADVTIGVISSDLTEGTVAPATVTFTTVNWATPQTITVTGANDGVLDSDIAYTIITGAAVSADTKYHGLNASNVGVTNIGNGIVVDVSGGGGGGGGAPTINTNMFGISGSFDTNSSGIIQETIHATSADGKLTIDIPQGTKALDANGSPLYSMSVSINTNPPAPPANANVIGLAYNFLPAGATFNPGITFTWSYDPLTLGDVAEEDLVIAWYNTTTGTWVELQCVVDIVNNKITTTVLHYTTFAIIAYTSPAAFTTTNLVITPAAVNIGVAATIKVTVANSGDLAGTYDVVLKVNNVVTETKTVTVNGNTSAEVTFSLSRTAAGAYAIDVNGVTGTLTVNPAPTTTPPTTTPPTTTPPTTTPPTTTPPTTTPPTTTPPTTTPPTTTPPTEAGVNGWVIGGILIAVVIVAAIVWIVMARRRD
jgi:hypothetical protein